jgi:hypothetical protein
MRASGFGLRLSGFRHCLVRYPLDFFLHHFLQNLMFKGLMCVVDLRDLCKILIPRNLNARYYKRTTYAPILAFVS